MYTVKPLFKETSEMQPLLLTGHHCSAPFNIPYIDMCTHKTSRTCKDTSIYRTAYCGPRGVLSIEVSLYRTAYCVPNGVLIIEVPSYTQSNCIIYIC